MFDGKKKKVQQWILENHTSLDTVIPLLNRDYRETKEDIGITFNHAWIPSDGNATVTQSSIVEFNVNGELVRCLPAYAKVEFLNVKKEQAPNVSRDIAVGVHLASVLFVELNGSVKILVASSDNFFPKIRSKLLKRTHNRTVLWGPTIFNGINLSKEFFYWLMSMKGQQVQLGTEIYTIYDLDAFNCSTERQQHEYEGTGQSLDRQAPVNTMISVNNSFTGLGIKIGNATNVIRFILRNSLETEINFVDCHLLTNNGIDFYNRSEQSLFELR
ncbi:hypothetical protein SAMN02745133_01924 [Desulforamulus putei DSM 12395]|uniref:Uncharacterized protein n=1 Tax=Desulforamulus putei DSM 12395 TaxID=1121429 RepID=A0A1M4ZAG4_9FIRM|nr:hypothetical protein [Desulforamulus putei]SHF14797.1 hypothetical protein SAMN02745133_01924 [Desulforamulus putei DSM 12395]